MWFRQDLRLADNSALYEADKSEKIMPIYTLDDENSADYKMGSASRFWLHYSLTAPNKSLVQRICCYKGDPLPVLLKLAEHYPIQTIFWNRCYEP